MKTQWNESLTFFIEYNNIIDRYVKNFVNKKMIIDFVEKEISFSVFRKIVNVFKKKILLFNHSMM